MNQPIAKPHVQAERAARERQAQLIKPTGALGQLEELACWFAARQGQAIPETLKPGITVFAADHGVAAQGISAYPQSVTVEMLSALAHGQAAIAVLANSLGARYRVVDMGVKVPAERRLPDSIEIKRVALGTQDISQQSAMSLDATQQALAAGATQAKQHINAGCNVLIAGEVGIGNTTSAACLICAHAHIKPELVVGIGTGLDYEGRQHKLNIVRTSLQRAARAQGALSILADLGGFEIAAMCGFYLEAARNGVPVLLDGFISTAAALCACAFEPEAREWMLATHQSSELGHALALEHLRLKPLFNLGMRLGEGSGAALALPLLQQALNLHRHMATFAEASVSNK
jgi:nicotinate-nucleotide--dimethylbenzimidazole phosphoribosyltransferase